MVTLTILPKSRSFASTQCLQKKANGGLKSPMLFNDPPIWLKNAFDCISSALLGIMIDPCLEMQQCKTS